MQNSKFNIQLENNIYLKSNEKMFNELLDFLNKISWKSLKHSEKYEQLRNWINYSVPLLNNNFFTYQTKIFWILNGYTDFPKCKGCKKVFNYINVASILKGYNQFCSHKCAVNSNEIKEKTKQTCLRKYGTTSPGQNEEVKKKSKQTCLIKYGTQYTFQSNIIRNKSKETLIKKYGVDHPSKIEDIKNKIKNTKNEKYGDIQPWHYSEAYLTRKQNWIKKYGVDHPCKTEDIKNKIKNTTFQRFGVNSILNNQEIKRKRLESLFIKYIANNEFDIPLFSFEDFLNRQNQKQLFKFKCKKCGEIFMSPHENGIHKKCQNCYKENIEKSSSDEEKEVFNFLKNISKLRTIQSDRTVIQPLELDIYIPDKKIAIEFDGLYWHSSFYKDKNYHLNKTKLCEEKGIQLIHIFENEWLYKQDIVKSKLKNILNIYDKKIYARVCQIKEISYEESVEFQLENHLQGSVNAKVNLGLYYNDELVSIMTFGKCRFNKQYEWEMLRFCSKLNYHVVGAASKLLKYFEKKYQPKSIVSYADIRWSKGNLYEKLGFKFSHSSSPNYWYFSTSSINLKVLYSRVKFQKHKQKALLKVFDENLSEVQNMENNKYLRIFDCGNLVFVKKY